MPELQTMTVRLRNSASHALAHINVADFDEAQHMRLEEEPLPSALVLDEAPPVEEETKSGRKTRK